MFELQIGWSNSFTPLFNTIFKYLPFSFSRWFSRWRRWISRPSLSRTYNGFFSCRATKVLLPRNLWGSYYHDFIFPCFFLWWKIFFFLLFGHYIFLWPTKLKKTLKIICYCKPTIKGRGVLTSYGNPLGKPQKKGFSLNGRTIERG